MIVKFNLFAKLVLWCFLVCLLFITVYGITSLAELPTPVRSLFLIATLAAGFIILLIAVQHLIRPLYTLKDRLRHESLTELRLDPLSTAAADEELTELFRQIQQLIDGHSRSAQKQSEMAETFALSLTQTRQWLEQDSVAIQKQKHLFQEIRVLIDDWSKWIPGLFKQLDQIQQMSRKHEEYSAYNRNLLDQIQPALQRMDEQILSRDRLLDELSKKIHSVLILTKRIHTLTDQTKLIAFNAAIEASTTGDIGRRFNVVASDIRKLADTVDSSNDDMGELISDMETLFLDLKSHLSGDAPQIALIRSSFQQMEHLASELGRIMKTIDQYANQWLSALSRQQSQIESLQITFQEMQSAYHQFQQTHRQLEDGIQRRMDQIKKPQPSIHRMTP